VGGGAGGGAGGVGVGEACAGGAFAWRKEDGADKMSQISRVDTSLRLVGDDLEPGLVTEKLGITPESAHRKGDVVLSRGVPRGHRPTGVWIMRSKLPDSASLDQHLKALLTVLEPKASAIQELKDKGYATEFYCGLFLDHWNRGTTLSPKTLGRIAALGAKLSLDIYWVPQKDESPQG